MSKKELVKEEIGKHAMLCFKQFGLDKTTLDDIAQAVGLNKASLYYYYKNKEDIFLEVAIKEGENYISTLQKKVLLKKGIQNQVLFYMESRFIYYQNILNMNRVSVDTLRNILPKFFVLYEALMQKEKAFLSQLAKNAVKNCEILKIDTVKLASVIINICDALKHSVEQKTILKRETNIDYTQSINDMKFLVPLMIKGLKNK